MRRDYLLEIQKRHDIRFSLFLFPDNCHDGMFETLLQHIIKPEYASMIDFFKEYEEKVRGFNEEIKARLSMREDVFETPDEKARIYSYISAFKRSQREKEIFKGGNWDFANEKYWDLDAVALVPFVRFLCRNFPK